jgi:hypothetical protein
MPEWKFHRAVAWALGLASGFVVFAAVAIPIMFGMFWGAMHPEDGKFEGTLLPELTVALILLGACIWLSVFVAKRLTR